MAFTITLPSNASMSTFPENTLATYTTLLPEYISLHGEHECALLEVTCPPVFYNLFPENIIVIEGRNLSTRGTSKVLSLTGVKMLLNQHIAKLYHDDDLQDPLLSEIKKSPFHINIANVLERGVEVVCHRTPVGNSGEYETSTLGVYASVGLPNGRLSSKQLQAIKYFVHLKELDKVVSQNHFVKSRKYRIFRMLGGVMKDNQALIDYLNIYFNRTQPTVLAALRALSRGAYIFSYDKTTMKCTIYLPPTVILKLPPNLSYQLGFGENSFLAGKTQGSYVVDVNYKANAIYVYSDVIESTPVGDRKVPLLRTITLSGKKKTTQTVSFQHLVYQPVCCSSFRQISIYLRDSTGKPIPFERGHVAVLLAFRPKE